MALLLRIPSRRIWIAGSFLFAILLAGWFSLGGERYSSPVAKSAISDPPEGVDTMAKPAAAPSAFLFEAVPGIFRQTEPETIPAGFDYAKHNFGLINRPYDSDATATAAEPAWQRLERYLHHLNTNSPSNVQYKLIYMGRHGEGDHNVAEAFYGTKAWDDYWSKLEGNGTVSWADAHLTATGKDQALYAHAFMRRQLASAHMPAPQRYYVSPLYRCLQTADLTFSGLELPADRPFKPLIKELLREVLGEHTCDRRSSRTWIHGEYPSWPIEDGFSEEDLLWKAEHRETHEEHDVRTQAFLDDVFANDPHPVLSFTSHSGAIASHLRVLGHRLFPLPTGGMIPVMVKATSTS